MKHLRVKNLGQIKKAEINFGELTLFVGPQATGKTLVLQIIKLLLDSDSIVSFSHKYGYDWEGDTGKFLDFYLGDGMRSVWNKTTEISFDNSPPVDLELLLKNKSQKKEEQLFFMPAQRVLTIANGWPKLFTDFEVGDPYVVRHFSNHIHKLMQQTGSGNQGSSIFPKPGRLKQELRDALDRSIFHGAKVQLNTTGMRKRIQINIDGNTLSFMTWSAGQREFMPLLLGLQWLIPSSKASKKPHIKWVVIEEPEMGLHPQAILSVILMCLELLYRGYRLIISTHSPVLLEAVWAIRSLKEQKCSPDYFYQLFSLTKSAPMTQLFESVLNMNFLSYYFDPQNDGVEVRNISSLDPYDDDFAVSNWGGLTSFSSQVSEVISRAVQESL